MWMKPPFEAYFNCICAGKELFYTSCETLQILVQIFYHTNAGANVPLECFILYIVECFKKAMKRKSLVS